MKNFNNFNNLISLADVMSRSSRRTDNLLSNKDATRQKDGKKTATTRQRCTMSNQGLFKKIAMLFAVLVMSVANVGTVWGATEDIDVKTKGNTSTTAYTGSSLTSMSSISFTATGGSASIAAASGSYTQFTTGTTTGVKITFTPKSGVTVNALEFTLSSGNSKGSFTYGSTNATITNSDKTHTLSGLSLSSAFDIYCHLVSGSSSQSIKVTNIKVTYSTGGGGSGKNIYLKPTGIWNKDGARFAAYYFKSSGSGDGWVDFASYNACTPCFKATIPSGYDKVILCRMDGSKAANNWDNRWNQTLDQTVPAGNDTCFTISSINGCTDGKSCGSWGTYTAPTYTISFEGNGNTGGSMSSISSIACEADQTVTANAYTKTGYSFTGWKADVDVKVGGSTKTAGTLLADKVTIQDISSNITLTAQWEEEVTYSVTYNANGGTGSVPTDATAYAEGASVTVLGKNTLSKAGSMFVGWRTGASSGTWYIEGNTFEMSGDDVTLYAQWRTLSCPSSGTMYSLTMGNVTTTEKVTHGTEVTIEKHATIVNGTATLKNKNGSSDDKAQFNKANPGQIYLNGADAQLKLELGCALAEGDSIIVTSSDTTHMSFTKTDSRSTTPATVTHARGKVYVIPAESPLIGCTTLYCWRRADKGLRVTKLIITRPVSCSTPAAPTDFTAGSISATGATFTITDAADAASYDIYYSTSSTAPIASTEATTTSTSKTKAVTGLTAATTYYAWVRSVCDASHKSAWVALNPDDDTHTFATSCVAPTAVNVTATVNSVSGYWFYPGDAVVLTAAPTGSPAGSPVTYQWANGGVNIVGATSSTYSVASATTADAGKYTCTISYGACSTTSAEFELKCMQFYLKNSGGSDISNHALTKVDATHATLSLSLTGGTTYKFRVTDGCNNWYGNSDATGITSSNCTNWTMPHDADCKVTTSSKTATYTFNFDFSGGLLGSEMKVSVVYPAGDQAEGKVIYWDNSVLNWASAPWYRIGKGTHNNKTQMTLVPGTANLYKVTTDEYNGFEYWHIANNQGQGTGNIFWTKDNSEGSPNAITNAMGFEGSPVTADAVTFTPTSSHATGTSPDNNNCEFYEYGQQNGMKTDRVTISPYSNGTITVNYTNTSNVASTLTSGNADLAHSVILTSITAVADEGYDASAITINGGDYSANYVVTGNTTIAASFTLKTYTISYNKGTNGTGSKASETKSHGVNFTLPGSTFTYGGHAQDGWSTSDGGALAYALSGSYTTNAAQEFFPHWKCNTPEISCSSNTITISVPSGATVYYTTTTDGSDPADPTSSSTVYNPSSKPTISADTKIKAIAIQSGCTNSAIASASLTYVAPGTSYYLFTPTSAPVHGGVLSGQFVTTGSKQNQEKKILGYTFPSYLNGVGTATSMSGRTAGSQGIQYYAKTTKTKFIIYYGVSSSSSTYKICIGRVSEGETSVTSTERSVSANELDTIQYEFTSTKNTTFSFHINNNNIWIYQIVAIESGTNHKQAGEPGYDLSFNKGRIALDNSSTHTITAEGLTIKSASNFKYTDATALSLAKNDLSNNQISFTTPASPGDLKLTWSGGQMAFNTSASADGATNITSGTAYSLSGSTTYYLINTGNSSSSVTKLQFVTAATTHSVTVEYNGSGSYGTAAAASTTVGEGSTTTITASPETGYQVNSWEVSGTGSSLSDDGSTHSNTTTLTMGTADATVTCTFGAISYTLAWSSNGGSELSGDYTSGSTAYGASITAPTDPTLSNYTFDGWKTNNDGTGTTAGSTMPAANTTYYAAWKQTVTLKTGAQGSGADETPYIYINGATLNGFTAHTASGYTLQGYYTAGSGGVKVLNADGTFAAANVTDYITSSKWSRTGAAPTLYAQWVAAEDCHTLKYAWKVTGKFCDDESTVTASDTVRFPANASNLYFTVSGTGNTVSKGSSYNLGNTQNNYFLLTAKTGYQIKSICFYGKVQDSSVDYTIDGSSWSPLPSAGTGSDKYYTFDDIDASAFGIKLTAASPEGVWIRNMVIEVCAAGGTTYSVTYNDNGKTGGSVPSDANTYSYGTSVTVKGNTGSLAKTDYTFAGWATNDDGTGSSYVEDNTFSITGNTTLYAKWTQSVTLNKNGGSTDGSATAVWNATGLTGITHAKPAAGYKLLGYYSEASDGTKVLNSDGSFAATNVTGYITSGKWSRTSATTLYAEYESAGALTWNLIVNSDTTNLSTSTKTSAFTEISTTNMTNAALTGLNYDGSTKKSSLTGKIGAPTSLDAAKYVKVTFQVASGYKFTPSSIKVPIQPVSGAADVKLVLVDNAATPDSIGKVQASLSKGSITTVEMTNGSSVEFTGTVTLKIYCYGSSTGTYRLGTPITIEGEVEEACGTMPSYKSMSYTTTTFAPGANASGSPITIVGGTNIDTYQWKYNTVNDRTSGTNCGTGTSLTPLTDAGAEADVTRYYWCEMTNEACGITIKSPAVAITVASAKSNATVTWTDPASTPNYGGGGYTIKATVDQSAWDGNAADLVITAPAGIRIYNVSSGTDGSSRKYVQADFDVQTSFDRTTYASNIPFTVSAAATATYNAISNDHNTAYSACSGGGEGSSYNIRMRKTVTKDGNYYHCANTDGWISPNISSSYSTAKAGTKMETDFDTVASSNTQYVWVRTYHANVNKVRIYADFRANDMTVSNVYKHTDYFTANNKYLVDYTAVYNDDEENENTGTAAQGYVDITLDEVMAANDILLVKFNDNKVRPLGAVITEGSAGSLNTHLQWSGGLADDATVAKNTTDAYFTYSASKVTENTNTLGAITYSSSDPSVATVDATGKVALVAAGSTTIKATLAASGCYKKAEISYTLNVTEVACAITAGTLTLTSGTETKCEDDEVTLTLTGFESDASIQWKDGDTNINNGGNYTIETDGTTSTLTTNQPGTYSVMVTKDCSVRSNRITISNKSTEVGAKRIVKNWYIKNGRPTPDIELWTLQNGAHLSSVAWDPVNATGLTASDFYESDGKVYLKGKEPSSNASGEDINYTLTLTVADDCGSTTAMSASEQLIYLHHQKNTDKHVLAFVVTGTEKGGFTEGITAAQTTSVELYNTIAANFDVLATNIYSTDDEQALKEYYSQFDILCITDYPNTGTKGVNKKSYVDALGALVDIRPILTMEAFVAKLANWKAKGISGTPQSPTTRQYTMLLQCKDHEIFSGTKLTKVGEGDTTMYRVSMVCDTLEDYKTLDATYGEGAHAEKSGYNYGGKPALQGFTFTKEMLDDDLLPLGLIDDGSGNDLQVGIERQTEMEARLMVLGINSYAMERLTDDGQTVVVNALKYLMKKNSEDIADCSNTFVGGDDEEDESTRSDWNVASHWSGNAVPDRTQKVRIVAPCVIKAGEKFHVTGVVIAPSGKYNHGANTANGSLTIAAGGALIVDGKVEAATAPLYTEIRATSAEDLTIQTSSTAQGALIFDNDKGETQATVEMYSKASGAPTDCKWQWIATPFSNVNKAVEFYYGAWMYEWDNATHGWTPILNDDPMEPFKGYSITQEAAGSYWMNGVLASTESREQTLRNDEISGKNNGINVIGNSWTAPIQIANFEAEDFTNAHATIFILNTGLDEEGTGTAGADNSTAGQYISIPVEASALMESTLKVIPAMQAFQVKAHAGGGSLNMDYDRLVREGAVSQEQISEPMRAPDRQMRRAPRVNKAEVERMHITIRGSRFQDEVYIFAHPDFTEGFDNGWDGEKIRGASEAVQLFVRDATSRWAVAAVPTFVGTYLATYKGEDNEYTISFDYSGDETLYWYDTKTDIYTEINAENTYTYTTDVSTIQTRFMITNENPKLEVPTGVESEKATNTKAVKFIDEDKMYIMINGRVYSADGALVK